MHNILNPQVAGAEGHYADGQCQEPMHMYSVQMYVCGLSLPLHRFLDSPSLPFFGQAVDCAVETPD